MKYTKNSNTQLNEYFNSDEFDCKCDYSDCNETHISPSLISILTALRIHFKRPVKITSGYRCEQHNTDIGGSEQSQHKEGKAADIQVQLNSPSSVQQYAEKITTPGLGKYDGFTHIDVREEIARWNG